MPDVVAILSARKWVRNFNLRGFPVLLGVSLRDDIQLEQLSYSPSCAVWLCVTTLIRAAIRARFRERRMYWFGYGSLLLSLNGVYQAASIGANA